MAGAEHSLYLDLDDIISREQSLDKFTYAALQKLPLEKQHDIIDKYLMGQSILSMTDLSAIVCRFIDSRLLKGREDNEFYLEATYHFFGNNEGPDEKKIINIMNTVGAAYFDQKENILYKVGVGIINFESIGGYFYSQEGKADPPPEKYRQQIIDHALKLSPTLHNVYIPDKTKLEEIEQYAQSTLEDAFDRYWNLFRHPSVHSSIDNTLIGN